MDRLEDQTMQDTAGKSRVDAGFVLVSVIWIAGLLAVVATAFAITVRSHTLAGSNVVYNTRAESVADGMALLPRYRLAAGTGAAMRAAGASRQPFTAFMKAAAS